MTLSQSSTFPSVNEVSQDTEREAFEAYLKRMPTWAPELDKHRGWVVVFAWDAWQACASIAVQPPAASQPSAQPPAGDVAKDAEILRALLTQYVEADEDRLGWTQCMKSQLYREALKTLDSAQVLPTKE